MPLETTRQSDPRSLPACEPSAGVPNQVSDSKTNQECGDAVANRHERQRHPEKEYCQDHDADGQCVAEREREECPSYGTPPIFLQSQGHGEEPTHAWVGSVICAEEEH